MSLYVSYSQDILYLSYYHWMSDETARTTSMQLGESSMDPWTQNVKVDYTKIGLSTVRETNIVLGFFLDCLTVPDCNFK